MTRERISDWILTLSVGLGLFYSHALAGLLLALLIRGRPIPLRWQLHHTLIALAAIWAVVVISLRGYADAGGLLSYYSYIWLFPLMMAAYKPNTHTLAVFSKLILLLFVFDLGFNLYASVTGHDLFGRVVDARDGLIGNRNGGLFAHSFYSGSISIIAFITLLARPNGRWLALFAIANLTLAGSWRLTVAIPVVAFFAIQWRSRRRRTEWIFILLLSLGSIIATLWTSGLLEGGGEVNDANTFRVFAWVTAIDKIGSYPLLGVGFPKENDLEGISFDVIDENLIAESWYLGSAIAFGVPYTLLMLGALVSAFFGKGYAERDLRKAVLFPFVMIDLTYGGFLGGILVYTWTWLLICDASSVSAPAAVVRGGRSPHRRVLVNRSSRPGALRHETRSLRKLAGRS